MVFFDHYGGGAHGGFLLRFANAIREHGDTGVSLFFVLSGFLITGILFDTRNDSRFFTRFYARRSVRIFPVFYLLLAVLGLLTLVFHYRWQVQQLWFLLYLGNFWGNSNFSLYELTSVSHPAATANIGHLWSLCVEEQFYLIWPLVVFAVRDRMKLIWTCVAVMALTLGLRVWAVNFTSFHFYQAWIWRSLMFQMDSMVCGGLLALLLRGPSAETIQRSMKWVFLAALLPLLLILRGETPTHIQPFMTIGMTLLDVASAGLIGMTLRPLSPAFRVFNLPPLRFVGRYSYGFYVFHYVFVAFWVQVLIFNTAKLHSLALGGLVTLPLCYGVTLLAAKLSYDLFEVKFLHLKERFQYDSELKPRAVAGYVGDSVKTGEGMHEQQSTAPGAGPDKLTAHRRSLHALTGIRFFAAAYVVIFHSRLSQSLEQSRHQLAANFWMNGYLAVPLFFILSGFILSYTYTGQMETRADHRRFYEARFARIWPLYALSLVLISIPRMILPGPGLMVATALMLQAWNPFDLVMAGAWNPVCWTLSCELFFYLCFPWVQTWLERRSSRTQVWALLAMVAVCVATNSASRTLWYAAAGVYRFIPLPVVHVPEFLVGVALGGLFLKHVAARGRGDLLPGAGVTTYAALLAVLGLLLRPPSNWTGLVVPAFAALVYALAGERTWFSRVLASRWLVLGGGMSYAMYLTQNAVKIWVTLLFDRLHLASGWLRLGATMLVLLLLSYGLFTYVENPVRTVIRGFFARREGRVRDGAVPAG